MFSIVFPIAPSRLDLFKNTKAIYDSYPQIKEFIIMTLHFDEVEKYLIDNNLTKDVTLIEYNLDLFTNPSMALNIGVRNANYDHIIITSPEVIPKTNVLPQLEPLIGNNIVCQVFDQHTDGSEHSLVNKNHRGENPGMYFLAMFNKSDIEKINGWDEGFMKGYAIEDIDFGGRWVRAGLPFEVREDIQAVHQYHPRTETVNNGEAINAQLFYDNRDNNVTYCQNGLATDDIKKDNPLYKEKYVLRTRIWK